MDPKVQTDPWRRRATVYRRQRNMTLAETALKINEEEFTSQQMMPAEVETHGWSGEMMGQILTSHKPKEN